MGWVLILPATYPPISAVLFFWFVGCFFNDDEDILSINLFLEKKAKPNKYRLSFNKYNLAANLFSLSFILLLVIIFFFFTIFFIKYKIELIFCCSRSLLFIYIYLMSEKTHTYNED